MPKAFLYIIIVTQCSEHLRSRCTWIDRLMREGSAGWFTAPQEHRYSMQALHRPCTHLGSVRTPGTIPKDQSVRLSSPNPYKPKTIPCLADVGLFVRPKSQQSPANKESPCKLNYLHNGSGATPYVKHKQQCHAHHCQILENPTSFTWAYRAFLCYWGDQTHCTFCVIGGIDIIEHHPHT